MSGALSETREILGKRKRLVSQSVLSMMFHFEENLSVYQEQPMPLDQKRRQLEQEISQHAAYQREREVKARATEARERKKEQNVTELLHYVVEGDQDKAEALLKDKPYLAFLKGTVTDLSKREFKDITGFQYALWALDWHMWTMLLKYLPNEVAAQQLEELERKGTRYGKHFSLTPLIEVLNGYTQNYPIWHRMRRHEITDCWGKKVRYHQLLVPVHVVNEYCHRTRSFYPCPEFKELTLERRVEVSFAGMNELRGDWFTTLNEDNLGVFRYDFNRAQADAGINEVAGVVCDAKALQTLSKVRWLQLEELKSTLVYRNTKTPHSDRVIDLLKYVVEGEQDKAEGLLKEHPRLVLSKGKITDLSNRAFEAITAFQYAVWALDWRMWTMLLTYMPKEVAALQLAELEEKGTAHGRHFDLAPLIEALNTYAQHYATWNDNQREQYWCEMVGGRQLLLPAHVVNEYCHPTRPFYPCPTFTEEAGVRSMQLKKDEERRHWFAALAQKEVGALRYKFKKVAQAHELDEQVDELLGAACDAKALQVLSEVRLLQLEQLKCGLAYLKGAKGFIET